MLSNELIMVQNIHLHLTFLRSFRRVVNFHVLLDVSDLYSFYIAASYCLYLRISMLCTSPNDHLIMSIGQFFTMLGKNVIIFTILQVSTAPL
jgi:hypothetical protein